MFSFSLSQGLVNHILVDISWDYGWKLYEKKWYLMRRMGKVAKGRPFKKKEKKEEKKSCSIVFWKVYIDGAWNQKKLSIGA
jgi:hypothetical protein